MLSTIGIVIAESTTGVSWAETGKNELDTSRYLSFELPFTLFQLCWIEALAIEFVEICRNFEIIRKNRIYAGGSYY